MTEVFAVPDKQLLLALDDANGAVINMAVLQIGFHVLLFFVACRLNVRKPFDGMQSILSVVGVNLLQINRQLTIC